MRLDSWLMALVKWAWITWACEVESQPDVAWGDDFRHFKCGYCREGTERGGYEGRCSFCSLFTARLCGVGEKDAYHKAVNPELSWGVRRRAARKMLRAILADAPREMR